MVHLIYRSKHYESQSKDYEFSRASMIEHWSAGMADTQGTLGDPRWTQRELPSHGVHVFDFASTSQHANKIVTPTTTSRTLAT